MIISHKLKIIFIKCKKVGGTSFEIALSRYCDSDDIITRVQEEEIRTGLGFTKSSNDKTLRAKLLIAKLKMFTGVNNYLHYRHFKTSISHLGAKEIKELVSEHIWNDYLKIAIIRSPYQKAISYYFWKKRAEKLTSVNKDFEQFISWACRRHKNNPLMDYDLIHISGESILDFVIRYENLVEDIEKLETKIALPGLLETYQSIGAKRHFRPTTGTSLYEVYSNHPKAKLMIDSMYYENLDKYELLREYFPIYKSEIEYVLKNKGMSKRG